ncbi:MAG: DNA repair protein RecO [Microgenomates group bacterium]
MRRILKTEAIVLKKRNLLNKDIIITLFTEKYGRLNVVAFGIKKITSRRLSHIQTGNLIKVLIYKKDDRFYLQESQLISGFSQIKDNQQKIKDLYLFFFVLDRLLPENQKELLVYQLTKKFLIDLSKSIANKKSILTKYLNKTLIFLGYLTKEKHFDEIKFYIEELLQEKIPSLM